MTEFVVVEQVGDVTFVVGWHPSEHEALLAAVDGHIEADEERELYVDGPGIAQPIPVGAHPRIAD